jgi:hypothetical protein
MPTCSGTGRAIAQIKRARPGLLVGGIGPVKELRDVGHKNGIADADLIDGDALALLNTVDGGINPYRTASHVTLLGVKNQMHV